MNDCLQKLMLAYLFMYFMKIGRIFISHSYIINYGVIEREDKPINSLSLQENA